MDEIEKTLLNFGLNKKEVKVYIACLQLGKATAFSIAEKSGVKRATTYLILNSLIKKALVVSQNTSKALYYAPTSPQNLVLQLEYKKKEIEHVIPSLMAIYNDQPEKPSIQVFEGNDGVKQVYTEIIEFLSKGEEILFYGSISHFSEQPALLKSWLKETKAAQGTMREMLNDDEVHQNYKNDVVQNQNPRHELRLIGKQSKAFLNDNAIFGNKVVIFSTQNIYFATVIESKEIASSYRTMFNLAWDSCK